MASTTRGDAHQLSLFQNALSSSGPHPQPEEPPAATTSPVATGRGKKKSQDQNPSKSQTSDRRVFQLEQALEQALTSLTELKTQVNDQRLLEDRLARAENYMFAQSQAIAHFKEQLAQHKDHLQQTHQTIAGLEADHTSTETKLLVLQQDRQTLRQENAQWQHACQELQQECDRQHRKLSALEQENTAMQEQILQQAGQSNEYETAVQYWKDQCESMQSHCQNLLKAIEGQLTDHDQGNQLDPEQLRQIIQTYVAQLSQPAPSDIPRIPPVSAASSLEAFTVPDFLIRRYQNRSKEKA